MPPYQPTLAADPKILLTRIYGLSLLHGIKLKEAISLILLLL